MTEKQWKWIDKEGLEDPNGVLHLFIKGAFREGIVDLLNEQEESMIKLIVENHNLQKKLDSLAEEMETSYGDYISNTAHFFEYIEHKGLLEDYKKYTEDKHDRKRNKN